MSYVNPSSLMGLAVAFFNIASILVVLRLLGRRMQRMRIGPDDILLVISWVVMLVMSIDVITAVAYGIWGKPLPPRIDSKGRVDPIYGMSPLLSQSYEFFFFQELIFPVQLMFAKLSILFFYRRIFCTTSKRDYAHWATLVVIVLTTIWGIAMFFMYLFQCGASHIAVSWASPLIVVAEYCLPGNIEVLMSGSDFGLDMLIFLLPMPRLLTLQLPTHKKVLVFAAFAVGGITMAASLVRMVMYVQLLNGANGQLATLDENMLLSTVMYWGMFEAGFAVSTACLPSIQYMVIKAGTGVRDAVLSGRATPFRSIRDRSLASSSDGRKGSLFSWNRKGSNLWKVSDRKGSTGSSSSGGLSHIDPKDLESGQPMGMGMNYGIRAPLEPISYNRTDVYAGY